MMKTMMVLATAYGCAVMLAGCASHADQERQWRLYAVDKCNPVRGEGTPAFDRCVEDTMTACEAKKESCPAP